MSGPPIQNWRLGKAAVTSAGGVVAAQSAVAARVGAGVLAAGGNAVDAAVATGFALAAVEPWMSGLGGGGYMLVAPAAGSAVHAIDFGMVAPAALDPADYPLAGPLAGGADAGMFAWPSVVGDRNLKGFAAVAVPGQVDGMRLALERFGTIAWRAALAPAIDLAAAGLAVDWYACLGIAVAARELAEFEGARAVYLPHGLPPAPLDGPPPLLPLGNLARTLRRLAEAGARDFYEGALADSIVADMRAGGGRLSRADLAGYRATVVPALEIPYRDAIVGAAPGLTAGPTLARVLGDLAGRLTPGAAPGPAAYLAYAESLRDASAERLAALGDSAPAPACTSHVSVIDRDGTMVALTQTLLSRFGAKVLLPDSGILMNNGIMWFDPRAGRPNSLAPGKRPLTNMCPVVARRGGRPWLALGASGGRRILPAVAQVLSFLLDFGMTLEDAFHCPRLDLSGDGPAVLDRRLPEAVGAAVGARLPVVRGELTAYPVLFASPNAVLRDGGVNSGIADIGSPWSAAVAAGGDSG
ncbi:MAG: gamma-glutamyltransferase [Dongiaceae bacterium]